MFKSICYSTPSPTLGMRSHFSISPSVGYVVVSLWLQFAFDHWVSDDWVWAYFWNLLAIWLSSFVKYSVFLVGLVFSYYGFYLFLIFWIHILSNYMYCKYLLPPFSFDSPCHVFWWTEAPNFNVVQYIFLNVLFCFSLTKSLAPPMSWKYSPILSSRSTIVSHLGLLTYNWFLMYGVR